MLTDVQRIRLANFLVEDLRTRRPETVPLGRVGIAQACIELMEKPRAQQISFFRQFIVDAKAENQAIRDGLAAQQAATEAAIDADQLVLTDIDTELQAL